MASLGYDLFDGGLKTQMAETWIPLFESSAKFFDWDESQKCSNFRSFMIGEAKDWYESECHGIVDYDGLRSHFERTYFTIHNPTKLAETMKEFGRIQEDTETVNDYFSRMKTAFIKTNIMDSKKQKLCILYGLHPAIKTLVKAQNLERIGEIERYALEIEKICREEGCSLAKLAACLREMERHMQVPDDHQDIITEKSVNCEEKAEKHPSSNPQQEQEYDYHTGNTETTDENEADHQTIETTEAVDSTEEKGQPGTCDDTSGQIEGSDSESSSCVIKHQTIKLSSKHDLNKRTIVKPCKRKCKRTSCAKRRRHVRTGKLRPTVVEHNQGRQLRVYQGQEKSLKTMAKVTASGKKKCCSQRAQFHFDTG